MKLFKVFIYISLLIILVSCNSQKQDVQTVQDGIFLSSISIALGGQPDETELTYIVGIWNRTNKPILLKSIEPQLEEPLKSKVLNKELVIEVNKDISPNSTISITGKFKFNTKGLNKEDVMALNPKVKQFKIITEQIIGNI